MISGAAMIVHLLLIPLAYGWLVIKPQDTEVLLGQSTYFNCSTSIITEDIYWYHYTVGATTLDKREVYAFGKIYEPYLGRFTIDEPFNGTFNLLINSVLEQDAGRYDCRDYGGIGDITSALLIVIVTYPVCRTTTKMDEVVGPNSCQLDQDKPELSCIVQYRGNIPPKMEWKSVKENVWDIQPNVTQETNDNNVTYHLMLKVDLFINGSIYICQTTRLTSAQLSCSLGPIKILYAFDTNFTVNASISEELVSSANSSQSCSYKWKWFQDDDVSTESRNASLKPTKPGWHKCEAECTIREQPCTILVMLALVYQTHILPLNSDCDCHKVNTIFLAVMLVLSFLFVFLIIGICFRMKKKKQPSNDIELGQSERLLYDNNDNIEHIGTEYSNDSNTSTEPINNDDTAHKDFGSKTDKPVEEEDKWRNAIRRHYDFLVDRMFTDFGLLDKLWMTLSISRKEIQKIKEPVTFYKRNKKCLDIILRGSKHLEFIEALKTSHQTHLINYLETDGIKIAKFDGEWPLTENEIETLHKNRENLVDLLDISDLLNRLYSTGVINRRQRDFINSKPTHYRKNEALLDILRRCSLGGYRQTIRCLHASNQSHIAEIFENGAVLVRIDATLQGEETAVSQAEEEIATETTNLLSNILPESNRTWKLVQLKLFPNRIALYFVCHQLSEVDQIQQLTKDQRLKETFETVFHRLNKTSDKTWVQLKRISSDFKQCRQYFKDITQQPKICKAIKDIQLLTMSDLPFELLDSILLKSYILHYVLKDKELLKNKDHHVISQLASVDICWFQRIRKRKFKKEVWRSLVVFYRRKEKISSIYRINRQYLDEKIQSQGLINRLKFKECLTNVQTVSLYRRNNPLCKKNSFKRFIDLITDVLKRTEAIHSAFRQCLWDTKQYLIGEIMKDGGAAVKVEIKFQNAEVSVKTQHQNLQIAERIEEIRDKRKSRSYQIEELVDKLMKDDLKLLSAGQDGDVVVVWIWCKTKHALERLQTMNKSKHILYVFTELVRNLSISPEERNLAMIKSRVNIDFEQFEKTVASFSIVANFTSTLDLGRKGDEDIRVKGITKLRNKIHVLLQKRKESSDSCCKILVFEDLNPFRLQKKIEIKEIQDPMDIASIEMENSFYVLDLGGSGCIWKIKEEGDEKEKREKIIRWLKLGDYEDQPLTLSVSKDGRLLVVFRRKNDPLGRLCIFGGADSEEAYLCLSIPLPEDIRYSCHAVETSKGNFIILHLIVKTKMEQWNGSVGGRSQMEEKMETEMTVVSEVSGDGKSILRRFFPKNEEEKLGISSYVFGCLAVDSSDRVFLADYGKDRVIFFDSNLQWNGILISAEKDGKETERSISSLFYDAIKEELIIGGKEVSVNILNRK